MIKRLGLCLLLSIFLVFHVSAEELGSIRLVMRSQGSAVSGGSVKLYDVTNVAVSDDPDDIAELFTSMGIDGTSAQIGSDGTVCFEGLKTGCYLVVQERAAPGYFVMKPFFVTVPITVDDRIQFRIDAFPKLEKIPETELPQTGQPNLPVWLLMGGGLLVMSIGFWMQKRE